MFVALFRIIPGESEELWLKNTGLHFFTGAVRFGSASVPEPNHTPNSGSFPARRGSNNFPGDMFVALSDLSRTSSEGIMTQKTQDSTISPGRFVSAIFRFRNRFGTAPNQKLGAFMLRRGSKISPIHFLSSFRGKIGGDLVPESVWNRVLGAFPAARGYDYTFYEGHKLHKFL